jgi:hypothetical protein
MRVNKNWLQEEQATLKQQVRQGKGLLQGGGSSIRKLVRINK